MPDRPNNESAREQYQRLAQECLQMVATVQDEEGRADLIEMARVLLRLAQMPPAATNENGLVVQQQRQSSPRRKTGGV